MHSYTVWKFDKENKEWGKFCSIKLPLTPLLAATEEENFLNITLPGLVPGTTQYHGIYGKAVFTAKMLLGNELVDVRAALDPTVYHTSVSSSSYSSAADATAAALNPSTMWETFGSPALTLGFTYDENNQPIPVLNIAGEDWSMDAAFGRDSVQQLTLALKYDSDGVPIEYTQYKLFPATSQITFQWDGEAFYGHCQLYDPTQNGPVPISTHTKDRVFNVTGLVQSISVIQAGTETVLNVLQLPQ